MKTIFIEVISDDYHAMMDEVRELVEINGDYDGIEIERLKDGWTAKLYYEQHETELSIYEHTQTIH